MSAPGAAIHRRQSAEETPRAKPTVAGLRVTCWCEAEVVMVSPGDVADGLTASCGRSWCHVNPDPPILVGRVAKNRRPLPASFKVFRG